MTQLFPAHSEAEFEKAFSDMDDDGSGEVDFDEFSDWWKIEMGSAKAAAAKKMREVQDKLSTGASVEHDEGN